MKRKCNDTPSDISEDHHEGKVNVGGTCKATSEFQLMRTSWCVGMDSEVKQIFLHSLKKEKNWHLNKTLVKLEGLCNTDPIFAFLVSRFAFDTKVQNRPSYHMDKSNGICLDDFNDRYVYLAEKLKRFPKREGAQKKEEYKAFLFKQEALRFKILSQIHAFNVSLRELHKEFPAEAKGSEFKPLPSFRLFPDPENEDDITCPSEDLQSGSCWGSAVQLELAYDILRLGSLKEVHQQMGWYYRVQFAYY